MSLSTNVLALPQHTKPQKRNSAVVSVNIKAVDAAFCFTDINIISIYKRSSLFKTLTSTKQCSMTAEL